MSSARTRSRISALSWARSGRTTKSRCFIELLCDGARWITLFRAGEVAVIAGEEQVHVVFHDVDLAARPLRLPGVQPPQAEVVVQADYHTLKKLLGRGPGGREKPAAVGRDAADQVVRRHVGAVRAGIAVFAPDARGNVQLAALVDRLFGAAGLGEEGLFPVDENEGLLDIGPLIASGEGADADAGLDPLGVHVVWPLVRGFDLEAHLAQAGLDPVGDHHVP